MRTSSKKPGEIIPTRQSLLSRLRDHEDSNSWQDFFNTYWKLIYGVAIKSGLNEIEAQEVVQETVIAVSKKMPGFKYDPSLGSFKAWLLNLTRWRIQDQFRKRRRDVSGWPTKEDEDNGAPLVERIPDPAGFDLESVWMEEWQDNLLHAAMEKIKPMVNAKQYQMFDLYVNKQWPVEKIGKTMGVTANQVYLAKHRIAELLRKEVQALETKLL